MVSGVTVIVAMAGMLFTGDKTFMSFGLAAMIVVAVAVIGSLTVLPALLSLLGDRVEKFRVPLVHRLRRNRPAAALWARFVDAVLRRPVVSIVLAGGFLLALAAPALQLHIASPGNDTLPQNLSAVRTYLKIEKAFPQTLNEATVMVRTAHADAPSVTAALTELERRALATGQFSAPVAVDHNHDGTIALLTIGMQGSGVDAKATTALHTLRSRLIPATVGRLPHADVGVTGPTAAEYDSNRQMADAAPWVFAFVLSLAFVLMLVTFRSIVIAVKAVLLNLLSVGRGLRGARAGVPARLGQEPARLRQDRRHRRVPTDLLVRHPVRALDGLPRVHPDPHPRGYDNGMSTDRRSRTASARPPASSPARRW